MAGTDFGVAAGSSGDRFATAWAAVRRRNGWVDHIIRAGVRYDEADGGRLAAAVTYYSFFASFALVLLGFASFGFVLDDPGVLNSVQRYLHANLPRLDAQAVLDARGTAGVIAFISLPITGLFWVDSLRSSIRAMWRLNEYPGNFFIRQLIDLAVLAGLGLLMATSLTAALGTGALLRFVVTDAVGFDNRAARWLVHAVALILSFGVNTLLTMAVLTVLPRLRMRVRRVLVPAVLVSTGLEILKTVGRLYVERTEANPAYQVVAGAVGLLVFLNLLNQLILFAAALTATNHRGRVLDMACHPPREVLPGRPRLARSGSPGTI